MRNVVILVIVIMIPTGGLLLLYGIDPDSPYGFWLRSVSYSQHRDERPKLDVPYEPSSHEVVGEMIRLAGVARPDIVYDLGCGDGRIVIEAALSTGAKGIGIDIDPARIREATENARKASVTDRVSFIRQNLFDSTIADATVVMLFLYPDVNLRLRPKLLSELKPGTRVVSHFHTMGEWKPDKSVQIGRHPIYFWVIPANVSGRWDVQITDKGATRSATLHLKQKFQEIRGYITVSGSRTGITYGTLVGNRLSFVFNDNGTFRFDGTAKGHSLKGTIEDEKGYETKAIGHRTINHPASLEAPAESKSINSKNP
jgi:SAM-dependent methyltransferase